MIVTEVIKTGILKLTKSKQEALDHEYNGFQWWMQFGIDKNILSQHKRAKGWYYAKDEIKYKDYPLVIPNEQIWFRNKKTKLTPYWIKISVRKRKGIGIWLPIKPHKEPLDIKYLKDSLLIKNKKGNYELRLVYQYEIKKIKYKIITAIDLGERNIATVCNSRCLKPIFYGRNIRGIRRHYAYMKKKLGQKKLLNKIKAIGNKEKRIVEQELHKIANEIVRFAKEMKSLIVIGDMKGIRRFRYRKLNRIIYSMPFFKLTNIITYKANQQGIQVIKINEMNTSKTCSRCGEMGIRRFQGLFKCKSCGYEINADFNGCKNILKRSLDYMFNDGVIGLNPKISAMQEISSMKSL
ncbi:MAG TPA: transposase [Candidatus Nanoarchaeia archaeon]|nr:transposase [Candidatus Nanoarchaeia archaeon]